VLHTDKQNKGLLANGVIAAQIVASFVPTRLRDIAIDQFQSTI
jgi:hypothetical protein